MPGFKRGSLVLSGRLNDGGEWVVLRSGLEPTETGFVLRFKARLRRFWRGYLRPETRFLSIQQPMSDGGWVSDCFAW